MPENAHDPVDHARTTRPHAGEALKDTANMPALVVGGLALVAFVGGLAGFATGNAGLGVLLVVIAAVGFAVAGIWLMVEHRRVKHLEDRWYAEHPEATPRGPADRSS